jgi:DNA-binding response OmpR family regulator
VQSDLDELLDDPDLILRQTRERFIVAFPGRCASIASLATAVATLGVAGPVDALRHLVHRLTGTAGIAAMLELRQRSGALEQLVVAVSKGGADPAELASAVRALTDAFELEMQQPAPPWAATAGDEAAAERILVVDDDPASGGALRAAIVEAGYRPFFVPADADLFDAIRVVHPALLVVHVDRPGVDRAGTDGHAISRQIKAMPEFATMPVVCTTTEEIVEREATGCHGTAMLRADEYASSTDDPRELVHRITATLQHRASNSGVTLPSGLLTYEAFVVAAQDLLKREAGSLIVARLARDRVWALTARAISHARPRDLIGRYDEPHVVMLLPGVPPVGAAARVREILSAGGAGRATTAAATIVAGVAGASEPGRGGLFDRLLSDADLALAIAGQRGDIVVTAGDDRKETRGV